MGEFGEIGILAYGAVTAISALLCYLAARFGLVSGWPWVAGVLRLWALWLVAAWLGYGTPIYVLFALLPIAVFWARLHQKLLLLLVFEIGVALFLSWHSQTPLLPINVAALLFIDQCLARFALLRLDKQAEPRKNAYRLVLVVGLVGLVALGAHFQRLAVGNYLSAHSLRQALDLVPVGAVPFWYQQRQLPRGDLPGDVAPSVYWQARVPATGNRCLMSLHGAASEGSLQGASQAIARGARSAGWRLYALDHPGFGASPAPEASNNIDSWNPGLHTDLLLREMRREGCETLGVIGHSQGVTEALRLFVNESDLAGVWVLGAGLYAEDPDSDKYWFDRFHHDRGLAGKGQTLARENWRLVRDLYYLNQEYCSDSLLGRVHTGTTPLNYVTFEREHKNLEVTREQLWSCLNYPKRSRQQLATDHYFDSLRLGGSGRIGQLVLVPRRTPALVAQLLESVRDPEDPAETPSEGQ